MNALIECNIKHQFTQFVNRIEWGMAYGDLNWRKRVKRRSPNRFYCMNTVKLLHTACKSSMEWKAHENQERWNKYKLSQTEPISHATQQSVMYRAKEQRIQRVKHWDFSMLFIRVFCILCSNKRAHTVCTVYVANFIQTIFIYFGLAASTFSFSSHREISFFDFSLTFENSFLLLFSFRFDDFTFLCCRCLPNVYAKFPKMFRMIEYSLSTY